MAFDTHAAAKTLEQAGFTEAQVDALIDVTRRTITLPDISSLATKSDLAELRAELKTEIANLRAEIPAAKAQAITVILSGMAVITAMGTVLSRLMR